MTNEDAACMMSRLKNSLADYCGLNKNGIRAFDLAIKALEAQDGTDTNVGSTISRQAAIDELKRISFSHWFEYGEYLSEDTREIKIISSSKALEVIEALPSAQPEIIRCKDCKHIQKWRSEESAKKFGQIYECTRNVFDCPKPEDFCSHAERRTDD